MLGRVREGWTIVRKRREREKERGLEEKIRLADDFFSKVRPIPFSRFGAVIYRAGE